MYLNDEKSNGFIKGVDGKEYYFSRKRIIKSDKDAVIHFESEVRFIPSNIGNDMLIATEVEIL